MFPSRPFTSRADLSYRRHQNQGDISWLDGSLLRLVRAALLVLPVLFALATPASAQSIILQGRAMYSTGEPAVNAIVRLTKTVYDVSPNIVTYETTITDAGGHYAFQIEARCAVVYETQATSALIVDGEALAPATISVSGCVLGDITFNDLTIHKPYQITLGGTVRDQFSVPVQGTTVIMTRTKYDVNPNIVTTASTTTDQNGHYEFRTFSRCAIVEAMTAPPYGTGTSSTSGCVLGDNNGLDLGVIFPSCGSATLARPANQTIDSPTGWNMRAEVSDTDGLVLRDVKLRHRYMAKEISVPYYMLETSLFSSKRGELKPDGIAFANARSRLVGYSVDEYADMLVIQATYAVDGLPSTLPSCLTITQRYEFYPPLGSCEPSETLDCARFKPIMQYRFAGSGGEYLVSLNIVQRDHFQVSGIDGNASGVFQDCNIAPWLSGCLSSLGGIAFANKINPMFSEFSGNAINHGLNGDWDNYHQTFNGSISEPGLNPFGCPECVHMHWRWATWLVEGLDPKFGQGLPIIPSGSLQDVDIALVRNHDGEEDPTDYHTLVNGEAVQTSNLPIFHDPLGVVFWYSATGRQAQDQFFTHGIFFNPSIPNVQASAGDVSVIYSDLYEDGALSVTPIDPASAGTLPDPYVPYNNLAYDVATGANVSGPHTVTFHLPTVTDPALLASMKVFHGEEGVLVDRTFGSDFAAKTISARVNSFSPFVIAVPVPTGSQLTSLGPAQIWVGLKNSDDVGTKFDLLAEVFKNGTLIGSGQLNDVVGGSSGFNNAKLDVINLALPTSAVFQAGDALKIKLSVRIAASSGHRSGTARLWFNDTAANSRFTTTVGGVVRTYFLRSSFGLATSAGSGPKTTVDVTVDRAVGGNPFKPFGTWTVAF